jgi:hypothetical protein
MLAALTSLLAGVSAHAQLYKWVDERGVTNYSNQPPVNPGAAKKLEVVADRVSVYTPDPALKGAIEAERQGRGVSARMVEQDRPQQAAAVAALPASGGPCAIWPSDCLSQYESYYYPPVYFTAAPRFHRRHGPQVWPDYSWTGPKPASRQAGFTPSRDRGRNSMQPGPKP